MKEKDVDIKLVTKTFYEVEKSFLDSISKAVEKLEDKGQKVDSDLLNSLISSSYINIMLHLNKSIPVTLGCLELMKHNVLGSSKIRVQNYKEKMIENQSYFG